MGWRRECGSPCWGEAPSARSPVGWRRRSERTKSSIAPSSRNVTAGLLKMADRVVVTAETPVDRLDVDVSIEASGSPEAISQAVDLTRRGGRVVLLGSPRRPSRGFDFRTAGEREIELVGAHISTLPSEADRGTDYREVGAMFLRLLGDGSIDLTGLVGAEVDPWEAGRFYRDLASGRADWPAAVFNWDRIADGAETGRAGWLAPPDLDLVRGSVMRGTGR